MKHKAFCLVFCVSLFAATPPLPLTPQQRMLVFDYPTNQVTTNLLVNFYRSTVVASNYLFFTNTPMDAAHLLGITNGTGTYALTITIVPGEMFFQATASNRWWGIEGPPSSPIGTDPVPVEGKIGIR